MVDGGEARVLLAGLPQHHMDAAFEVCTNEGRVVIPAGGPGDLDQASSGMAVLLMISGEDAVPAVTWRATFLQRVVADAADLPDLLPSTWLEERQVAAAVPGDEREEDEDEDRGPQSYFEVEHLEPLPKHEWIFANELVRKQERGGRAYFPRAPRLVRAPV